MKRIILLLCVCCLFCSAAIAAPKNQKPSTEANHASETDHGDALEKKTRQLKDNFYNKHEKCMFPKSMTPPSKEALRDLREARDAYKKSCEDEDESDLSDFKNRFKEFKETQCKHITKEQRKDLETAYNKYIGDWKASDKAYYAWIDAMYETAEVNWKYLKDNTFDSKNKLEQEYQRHEAKGKAFEIAVDKLKTSARVFSEKAKKINGGEDFFEFRFEMKGNK